MKLQESRKTELAELAEAVVEMNSPRRGPVDLVGIANAAGIKLHYGEYDENFDGLIAHKDGIFHIHLNLRRMNGHRNSSRARFTLAHELGHYFIDEHRNQLITGKEPHASQCGMFDGADCIEEQEADFFAASLIMPPSRFIPAACGLGSPLETILALANTFDASLTATALQYTNHVSDRCLVVRWTTEGSHAWAIPGRGYRVVGFRSILFKSPDKLPPDSATGNVIANRKAHDSGVLTMAHVFQNVAMSGDRDSLVAEEAIALGSYGVLTIISDFVSPVTVSPRALRRRAKSIT